MLVEIAGRRRGAEAVHADEAAARAEPAIPAETGGGLHRDARRRTERRLLVGFCLALEQFPARHGDDRRLHALGAEKIGRCERDLDLRARRQQRDVARAHRLAQHIGAARAEILVDMCRTHGRQCLARQRERRRTGARLQRRLPAFGGLDSVSRPEHQQIRRRAQHGEMLDRLMRRPVFAETNRVMRQHIDDTLAHQRRQTHAAARIVGEDHERAAVGDEPAVQRQAVHRRRHAVFANAVVHVATGERIRADRRHALGDREIGMGEIGRAADRQIGRAIDRGERGLRGLARRDLRRALRQLTLQRAQRARGARRIAGQLREQARAVG